LCWKKISFVFFKSNVSFSCQSSMCYTNTRSSSL
jgi:hypothetical protein